MPKEVFCHLFFWKCVSFLSLAVKADTLVQQSWLFIVSPFNHLKIIQFTNEVLQLIHNMTQDESFQSRIPDLSCSHSNSMTVDWVGRTAERREHAYFNEYQGEGWVDILDPAIWLRTHLNDQANCRQAGEIENAGAQVFARSIALHARCFKTLQLGQTICA